MRSTNRASESPSTQEIRARLGSTDAASFDIVALTAHNLDTIYTVERVAADHEVRIGAPHVCPGGSGANTAAALAGLGRRVAAAGIVADDAEGAVLREGLAGVGIDLTMLRVLDRRDDIATGRTLVFTDSIGRRSIYVDPGVNEILSATLHAGGGMLALASLLRSGRIAHFSSFTGLPEFRLQEQIVDDLSDGVILSFNPGALYTAMGADRLASILRRTNVLAMYEQQLDALLAMSSIGLRPGMPLQAKLESLFAWKARRQFVQPLIIIVKSPAPDAPGIRESAAPAVAPEYLTISCGSKSLEDVVPTQARVDHASLSKGIDSTGAGDALTAGVLLGLLEGESLPHCADLAFTMACAASQQVGARTSLPKRTDLDALMTEWLGEGRRA